MFNPIQEGKWDAAFAVLGNPDIGFDFKSSPLGEDGFDYFSLPTHVRYRDAFTGFVFFKPLNAHRMSIGLPAGLFDEQFANDLLKRYQIQGEDLTKEDIEQMFGAVHIFGYDFGYEALPNFYKTLVGQSNYTEKIQHWLKLKP